MDDPDSDFKDKVIEYMGYTSNVNEPLTTMAYVSKDGWCAQTPIPTKYVEGAVTKIGNMQVVIDKTCA